MTRTALAPTPSLPPCMLAPELWDSSDNTEAIAACRQQCPRRFACAQEALAAPKHLVSTLNGVIAGVAIAAQNEYGTSKAHKAALKRLETIAEIGREPTAATTNPCARPRQAAAAVAQAEALTSLSAKQIQPSVEGQELGRTHEQQAWDRPEVARILRVPHGDWGAEQGPNIYIKAIPKGQVDVYGAARMTGLTVATLRGYRRIGRGPKSWLAPGGPHGVVRYWVTDIETWMAQRQPRPTVPAARAS